MNRPPRRLALVLAFVLALVLLVVACGGPSPPGEGDREPGVWNESRWNEAIWM
jgi:hypothetical protein